MLKLMREETKARFEEEKKTLEMFGLNGKTKELQRIESEKRLEEQKKPQ